MKVQVKRLVFALIISLVNMQLYSQQPLWNIEKEKAESYRKIIDSLKIHEVKAFQYVYNGGKKNDEAILAEYKKYNPKGYITYEYSTIDHELSYIFGQKCVLNTQYSEDVLTDGGLYNQSVVTGNFEDIYMLPSVYRYYTYVKDTLRQIIEAYPIDGDTSIASVTFAYNIRNYSSIQEKVFVSSKNWLIGTSRDLYLSSKIDVSKGGPWIYYYDVAYFFNNNHDVMGISGTHATRLFSTQHIFNKEGRIEKTFANYNGSSKVISKYSFEYDTRGNVTFADISDVPGHIQIKKKYDQNNNITEYERIQVEENKKLPGLADARYRHCYYKYDNNGLLKERIDVGKSLDTLYTISYVYWSDNNNTQAITEKVDAKLKVWMVKGKYESTGEYNNRISEVNIKKQSELYIKEAINEIGQERYNTVPIKMEYDADSEWFTLTFEELTPLFLYVPRNEAEDFEKNLNKYTMDPQFEEVNGGLILKSCIVKSAETGKEYKSVIK